jgi:predicted Zn-dependent peptidase
VYGLDADYREQLTAIVDKATLEGVNRVIRDVLDPENYVFVEAGAVGD